MREIGHAVVDRIVERWTRLGEFPAAGYASRAELERRLGEPVPVEGRPLEEVLERFWRDVEPFAGRIDHPRFFAFIPSSPTFASLVGEWLAAGCNFFQGTWIESAGPSQVEAVVLDWLARWFELPDQAGGLFTSGGSVANLLGLAAGREEKLGGRLDGAVAYASEETHSSVDRAFRVLGLRGALRRLPARADGTLDPEAVAEEVRADRAAGRRPFCLVANAGTTNRGAVDPLSDLASLAAAEDLWFHVDAAYGAFAWLTPRGRRRLEGLPRADSLVLDPHKWLYVGYEAGCVLVRDAEVLRRTFHVLPEYLQDTVIDDAGPNFADYGVQLTRSARALKVWFALQTHGERGMAAAIDRTQDLAELAERAVRREKSLELVSPASLGIVCFRWRGDPPAAPEVAERANREAVRRIQREGRFMLSSTVLDGRTVVRLCPLNYRTTESDVRAALAEVRRVAAELAADRSPSGPRGDEGRAQRPGG